MEKIKQGGINRRLSLGIAGAKSGIGLLTSKATAYLVPAEQRQAHNDAALERQAMRFVKELGELKGAYVKIGQMLALYGEHLLPAPLTKALHTLETQTQPLSWSTIKESLPENIRSFDIEEKAFAAASLSQIHQAKFMSDQRMLDFVNGHCEILMLRTVVGLYAFSVNRKAIPNR